MRTRGALLFFGAGTGEYMTGGAGSDRFIFEAADYTAGVASSKYVNDYTFGEDTLEFTGFTATALTAFAPRDTTSGLRLTLATSNYVYLKGITSATIAEIDVIFDASPAGAAALAPLGDGDLVAGLDAVASNALDSGIATGIATGIDTYLL